VFRNMPRVADFVAGFVPVDQGIPEVHALPSAALDL
jgi:hypothetical protein